MVVRGLVGVSAPSSFRYHTYMLDQLRNLQKTLNACFWLLVVAVTLLAVLVLDGELARLLAENAKLLKQ